MNHSRAATNNRLIYSPLPVILIGNDFDNELIILNLNSLIPAFQMEISCFLFINRTEKNGKVNE